MRDFQVRNPVINYWYKNIKVKDNTDQINIIRAFANTYHIHKVTYFMIFKIQVLKRERYVKY